MKRFGIALSGILCSASLCFGQAASAPGQSVPHVVAQGAFPVKVLKTLDSSKLKQDETIEVETAGIFKLTDGTLVPKGSKLMGRVVTAKARSKGDSDSELTLAFGKLSIPGGKEFALTGTVQAVYPPAEEPAGPNMATAGTSRGGSVVGSALGGAINSGAVGITDAMAGSNPESSSQAQQVVNVKATGVQGMHDLSLDKGVIMSKGKNVKLGGGARIVVHADFLG